MDLLSDKQKESLEREATTREDIRDSVSRDGVGGEFKCGETLLKVDKGSPLCVDWKNFKNPLPVTTQRKLNKIGNNIFFKDLANFAAQKVWRSYTLGLISDPNFSGRGCPSGDH